LLVIAALIVAAGPFGAAIVAAVQSAGLLVFSVFVSMALPSMAFGAAVGAAQAKYSRQNSLLGALIGAAQAALTSAAKFGVEYFTDGFFLHLKQRVIQAWYESDAVAACNEASKRLVHFQTMAEHFGRVNAVPAVPAAVPTNVVVPDAPMTPDNPLWELRELLKKPTFIPTQPETGGSIRADLGLIVGAIG
jgi:hypothetical protein